MAMTRTVEDFDDAINTLKELHDDQVKTLKARITELEAQVGSLTTERDSLLERVDDYSLC